VYKRQSVVSSFLFGLAHFFNLHSDFSNIQQVLPQVCYTFLLGIGFCGVFLKTKSIIPLIVIHMFLNFGGMVAFSIGFSLANVITFFWPIVSFLPLAVYGLLLIFEYERDLKKERELYNGDVAKSL